MSEVKQIRVTGISFCGLLALLFIALKLTGHVAWAWQWVLAPLWAPIAVVLGVVVVFFAVTLAVAGVKALASR